MLKRRVCPVVGACSMAALLECLLVKYLEFLNDVRPLFRELRGDAREG
jgi:hypothetical protein